MVVVQEINHIDTDFKAKIKTATLVTERKKQEVNANKPSDAWKFLPVAGWIYHSVKTSNANAILVDLDVTLIQGNMEKERSLDRIGRVLENCNTYLVPALSSYLEAVTKLQMIFQEFQIKVKGFYDNMENADSAVKAANDNKVKLFHNAMKKRGKRLAAACASTIHLYNIVTAQFDAL